MDLLSIFQDNKITYSHLNLTWALIADIDIESEKYRWMGEARLIVGALIRLLKLRVKIMIMMLIDLFLSHNRLPDLVSSITVDQSTTYLMMMKMMERSPLLPITTSMTTTDPMTLSTTTSRLKPSKLLKLLFLIYHQ